MNDSGTAARQARYGAIITAIVLVLSACTTSTGGTGANRGASSAGPSGDAADPPSGSEPDSITSMLQFLPALAYDDPLYLWVNRWHAAAAAYGVGIPGPDASVEQIADYVISLSGMARTTSLMNAPYAGEWSTEEQFGYRRQDIAVEAQMGPPPRDRAVAIGQFDRAAVTAATAGGPVGPDVEQIDISGVPVQRWHEDFHVNQQQLNVLSPFGSSGRLAVPSSDMLLYSTYDKGINDLIGAQHGQRTLADDPGFVELAELLDSHQVLSAQMEDGAEDGPLAAIYTASGFYWDGDPRVVLAYRTASDTAAAALAESFKDIVAGSTPGSDPKPWSTVVTDLSFDIDGPIAIATFTYPPGAYGWVFLPYLLNGG